MDNLLSRHRNVSILVAVLFAQVLGLAVQVKRSANAEESRLIRVWAVSAVTPFEKALVWTQNTTSSWWHNYLYLRGVRAENRDLKQQIERMRLEQVRLSEDAEQARRLQLLFAFKEKFISKTLAAQVIGSSGSEKSRSIYIDKGSHDGVEPDQAVITAQGIVGKVLSVYGSTSLVLLINDQSSGVGVILEKTRLQGVLRGSATGQVMVEKILNDETVQPGERVLTSGGDQIFPKGLDVGTVAKVSPGKDAFLEIRLQPAAHLSKLEEILVVTKVEDRAPTPSEVAGQVRAVDILTRRLPSVPDKPAETGVQGATGQSTGNRPPQPTLSTGAPKTVTAGQNLRAPSAAKATASQGAAGQGLGAPSSQKSGVGASAGTSAKPANPAAGSGQANLNQAKPSTAGAPAGTAKPGASSQTPTSPAEVKKVPSPNPNNIGTAESAPNAKAPAKSALKTASSTADPALSNDVKPALVQTPVNLSRSTPDQSANPAKKQAQPAKTRVEDNPQ
jgi:rod shape-determining protein MreC